jgi:SAM-dependent methyltransferase
VVADEYYILSRHPTCSNFRTGSTMIIAPWLLRMAVETTACEVGAGKSIVAELLLNNGRSLHKLLITDESARMLEYSRQFEAAGATLKVASAERLPAISGSIDWMVASLGDPYNNSGFWAEASRILKPGGAALFTTPAYDWAKCFRREGESSSAAFNEAEFELMNGRRVRLPSFIYSEEDQLSLVEKSGLIVREVIHITIADLKGEVLSPKLCLYRGSAGPVVTGFLTQKPWPA